MDPGKITRRVKSILTAPKTEWPLVAAEPDSVRGLYVGYIVIVAALPALAAFVKDSLIGYSGYGLLVRSSIGEGIVSLVLRYVITLVLVYVMMLIIDVLAPTFGGRRDTTQALKVVAYSLTASWIAGIAVILPWIGWLIMLIGGIYAIYLLYLGLPHTMKCPADKTAGYATASVLIAILLSWVVGLIVASVLGANVLGGAAMKGMRIGSSNGTTVDSIAQARQVDPVAATAAAPAAAGPQAG